ncbi:hypothetical protein [Paraburkholderia lycopersici]|uniref:Uncharacterized protein n=1 Tax=Paraburkholderia lycopersici TaxID=416944 RepID=A0A1G7CMK0_9BURK|nr:hypothetical protein [Paraburkholderia lycopersici]SDE39970.1 hypothetical protein SAMN05421548_14616 [Paraburkholderia lycopersici]
MQKTVLNRIALSFAAAGLSAMLAACGGGGSGSGNNETNDSTPPASGTATPLAAGKRFVGTVSFGDTVRVDLDSPAAGQLTLTFVDSQFGLAGALVGKYTKQATSQGTAYSASALSADGAPAALTAAAANIRLDLTLAADAGQHGLLSGALQNVPNVKAADGSLLQGQILATNNGVTSAAALAGTYSFVKLSGNYSAGGVPQGDQDAEAGQVKIDADGTLRFCSGQPWSATCTNYDPSSGNATTDTGTIMADPNQALYPGAFDITLGGNLLGRAFVSAQQGATSIFIDQAGNNTDGTFRTGTWTLTSANALAAGALDGTWTCTEPGVADNSNRLTGAAQTTLARFSGTQLQALNADGSASTQMAPVSLFYNRTFDPRASQSQLTLAPANVAGLVAGQWTGSYQNQSVTGAFMFLPVSATQISYLDEVNANGFFVMGTCTR